MAKSITLVDETLHTEGEYFEIWEGAKNAPPVLRAIPRQVTIGQVVVVGVVVIDLFVVIVVTLFIGFLKIEVERAKRAQEKEYIRPIQP